ncbi:hypothetical protein L1049_018954 [Liquidambar formosana]|uniref:RNase H type-1 domain-containing protein n=1 Tax=Liquidambar formosana TaxID=63359 RepID=A0AAP0RAT5_LIQFO
MMEIRVFVPGARPDRFRQIIPIRPGESEEVNVQAFCYENSEEHPIFRFFVDGVDTGASIVPRDLVNYVKITCDCDEKGVMQLYMCYNACSAINVDYTRSEFASMGEYTANWIPPPPLWAKLNTDGSSLGNPGPAGAGELIRDHNGQWIVGFIQNVGRSTSMAAELWALRDGLQLAFDSGIRKSGFGSFELQIWSSRRSSGCSGFPTKGSGGRRGNQKIKKISNAVVVIRKGRDLLDLNSHV